MTEEGRGEEGLEREDEEREKCGETVEGGREGKSRWREKEKKERSGEGRLREEGGRGDGERRGRGREKGRDD